MADGLGETSSGADQLAVDEYLGIDAQAREIDGPKVIGRAVEREGKTIPAEAPFEGMTQIPVIRQLDGSPAGLWPGGGSLALIEDKLPMIQPFHLCVGIRQQQTHEEEAQKGHPGKEFCERISGHLGRDRVTSCF